MKTNRTKAAAKVAVAPKAPRTASNSFYSFDDPDGSYTGTCKNRQEKPIQDADDL